jgi:hypothetical protein
MKTKVYEISCLSLAMLDAAVWVARGNQVLWGKPCRMQMIAANVPDLCWIDVTGWQVPRVTRDWGAMGMLIEQYGVSVMKDVEDYSTVDEPWYSEAGVFWGTGKTPLIAAARALAKHLLRDGSVILPDVPA